MPADYTSFSPAAWALANGGDWEAAIAILQVITTKIAMTAVGSCLECRLSRGRLCYGSTRRGDGSGRRHRIVVVVAIFLFFFVGGWVGCGKKRLPPDAFQTRWRTRLTLLWLFIRF